MDATCYFLFSLSFFALTSIAHADIIIGYRGKGGAFDVNAFKEYANKRNLQPFILNSFDTNNTITLINKHRNYQFYGYSMGAASVSYMMKVIRRKRLPDPKRIITVGAYRTVDVNYTKYKVPFINYFDRSGRGQRSPGIYINVDHNKIMSYINKLMEK